MQDSFKIFAKSFGRLKNVAKILHLVALIHSGYLVNYFYIEIELGLFGKVSSSNIKSENDEILNIVHTYMRIGVNIMRIYK